MRPLERSHIEKKVLVKGLCTSVAPFRKLICKQYSLHGNVCTFAVVSIIIKIMLTLVLLGS